MNEHEGICGSRPLRAWPGQRGRRLRFVLLHHFPAARAPHFDLMLELDPDRKLWDLETPEDPTMQQRTGIRWEAHGRHRRRYLHFEGDIGQGRGVVKRIEWGRYIIRKNGGALQIRLAGQIWKKTFEMQYESRGQYVWMNASECDGPSGP